MNKNTIKLIAATQILLITLLVGCTAAYQNPLTIPITAGTAVVATTVCHATGNPENPYEEVIVNSTELAVHVGHASDIIPAPVGGCPTDDVVIIDGTIIVCHTTNSKTNPYEEITISLNGLNGHGDHEGDFFPAVKGECLAVTPAVMSTGDGKITICHATNSKNHPYNLITVSVNGLNGHDKHAGDIIPAPAGGCPSGTGKK
jgi:hypothetical protein